MCRPGTPSTTSRTAVSRAKASSTVSQQPVRQIWQVADVDGHISGVVHSMLLPVPMIYAGIHGEPGHRKRACRLSRRVALKDRNAGSGRLCDRNGLGDQALTQTNAIAENPGFYCPNIHVPLGQNAWKAKANITS